MKANVSRLGPTPIQAIPTTSKSPGTRNLGTFRLGVSTTAHRSSPAVAERPLLLLHLLLLLAALLLLLLLGMRVQSLLKNRLLKITARGRVTARERLATPMMIAAIHGLASMASVEPPLQSLGDGWLSVERTVARCKYFVLLHLEVVVACEGLAVFRLLFLFIYVTYLCVLGKVSRCAGHDLCLFGLLFCIWVAWSQNQQATAYCNCL